MIFKNEKDGELYYRTAGSQNVKLTTSAYQDAATLPVTTITREFAEVVLGPWYEWSPTVTAAVEPHIPSDRDMEQQFRRRLDKLVPGTECMPCKSVSSRYVTVDGNNYERSKRYLRVSLPAIDLLECRGLSDVVRRVYFDAADLLADTIALQVAELKLKHERVSVRWFQSGLMHHKTAEGARRVAVDQHYDRVVALIAAYYVVAPTGELRA